MKTERKILDIAVDFGEWLVEKSKKKNNAIIIVILSIFSPLAFLFSACMIAYNYRKSKRKS